MACTAVVGSRNGESDSDRSAMSTSIRKPYADVLVERRSRPSTTPRSTASCVDLGVARRPRTAAHRPARTRRAPGRARARSRLAAPPRRARRWPIVVTTPDFGRDDHALGVGARSVGAAVGVDCVEQASRVVADELDQRRHPQRPADVVHVQHEHTMLMSDEQIADDDRRTGHLTVRPRSRTSRRASIAWANVATKRPIAIWLGLSWRIVCTMRGENCPIASWTTTIVIVRTSAARLTPSTRRPSRGSPLRRPARR